jgi:hypothetical protein
MLSKKVKSSNSTEAAATTTATNSTLIFLPAETDPIDPSDSLDDEANRTDMTALYHDPSSAMIKNETTTNLTLQV